MLSKTSAINPLMKLAFLSLQLIGLLVFTSGFYSCVSEDINFMSLRLNPPQNKVSYIDTRVGTGGLPHGNGHTSPAAAVPFGLTNVGPDSALMGTTTSTSGYSYFDTEIRGFSHTRYSGTGLAEGGFLRITPVNESLNYEKMLHYLLRLDHDSEVAVPGFYEINFKEKGIRAEMTATTHGGYHRYTFSNAEIPRLIIEPTSQLKDKLVTAKTDFKIDLKNNRLIGRTIQHGAVSGRTKGLPTFFYVTFNQKITDFRVFTKTGDLSNESLRYDSEKDIYGLSQDKASALYIEFAFESALVPVEAKVAVSYVDEKGARSNYNFELANKSFDLIRNQAKLAWEDITSRVEVETQSVDDKIKFYTALYHSFLMPNVFSDHEEVLARKSRFLGYDKKIHEFDGPYYANFSLWDTFRTTHPLYILIAPNEQAQMIRSLIHAAEVSGRFPRWGGGNGHADSMLGFPAHITIAETYLKGIQTFDIEKAYSLMRRTAFLNPNLEQGQECFADYVKLGYCSYQERKGSVSYTLEYSYADYSLALLAKELGKTEDYELFIKRSQNYRKHWESGKKLFVARSRTDELVADAQKNQFSYMALSENAKAYFEGSPNQWRWYVPYAIDDLVSLMGESFVPELRAFFEKTPGKIGAFYPGTNYWHGNEPGLHASYLFAAAGRPDLTQETVRKIIETKYQAKAQGLDGDDDAGTISSWFVLSSLGFYPIAGTTRYYIGYPLFDSVKLKMGDKILVLKKTTPQGPGHYIKSVTVNGIRLPNPWFEHDLIKDGGEIVFEMSPTATPWNENR